MKNLQIWEEIKNLYSLLTIKEVELVIKEIHPTKNNSRSIYFLKSWLKKKTLEIYQLNHF